MKDYLQKISFGCIEVRVKGNECSRYGMSIG